MTCNRCGSVGHRARFCSLEPKDYKNIIEIKENKLANIDNVDKVIVIESPLNVSTEDLDIHIESSQSKTQFECTECEYKCSYEHIFNEHLETHTGEKFHSCSDCGYQPKNMNDMKKHEQKHKEEKTFKCDKCDYECNSAKELSAHVKMHNQKMQKCTKCEHTCITVKKLNTHMRTHTGEESPVKTLFGAMFEIETSAPDQTPLITNSAKRGLSESPEVVGIKKSKEKKKKKYNSTTFRI